MANKRKSIREVKKDSLFPVGVLSKEQKSAEESETVVEKESKTTEESINKKKVIKIIKSEGASGRKTDSIRINPILQNALLYWSKFSGENKSKPNIIEDAILSAIPEEYLVKGYEMTKKNDN